MEKLENKWKSKQCFQFKKQGLMQLQIDDYSFLCSAPALPLPQWELQLANCLNFWPGKFGTTLAELSWREPLWIFWSPLFHTGLKWSPNWLSFFCPPCLLSQVPGALEQVTGYHNLLNVHSSFIPGKSSKGPWKKLIFSQLLKLQSFSEENLNWSNLRSRSNAPHASIFQSRQLNIILIDIDRY